MGFSRSYNWRVGYSVIFTDREIIIAIERGLIIIDPRPNSKYFASTSVDLTLDPVIAKFKPSTPGLETTVDPDHEGFKSDAVLADLTESISIGSDGFLIPPKTLFLAWTKEYVELKTETRVCRESRREKFFSPSWAWGSCNCSNHTRWLQRSNPIGNDQPRCAVY
jgi:hypothetical protein